MRTEIDLDAAAAAGIIGEDQAIALRNFQAQRDGMSGATSEKFQIFGGYADLVIAIGAAMVLIAVAIAVGIMFEPHNTGANLLGTAVCAGTALALFRLTERINLRASPAMGVGADDRLRGLRLLRDPGRHDGDVHAAFHRQGDHPV